MEVGLGSSGGLSRFSRFSRLRFGHPGGITGRLAGPARFASVADGLTGFGVVAARFVGLAGLGYRLFCVAGWLFGQQVAHQVFDVSVDDHRGPVPVAVG